MPMPLVLYFFFGFFLMEKILFTMVFLTMDHCVLPNLASTRIMYASFDLWMSSNNVNFFAMVINFLNDT
jgi:hypothetical protein